MLWVHRWLRSFAGAARGGEKLGHMTIQATPVAFPPLCPRLTFSLPYWGVLLYRRQPELTMIYLTLPDCGLR
jgi:hypothetical protein